jgi:FkbM family methyltransferase
VSERAREGADSDTVRTALAATSWAATLVLCAVGVLLSNRSRDGAEPLLMAMAASAIATATIGAVVAAKTRNPTGWLLIIGGLALAAGTAAGSTGRSFGWIPYLPCGRSTWPKWIVLVSIVGPAVWAACATTAVTFFPLGPSRPLRDHARILVAPAFAWLGTVAFLTAPLARPAVAEPSAQAGLLAGCRPGVEAASIGLALMALGYVGAVAITLIRLRRVSGSHRDQLRPVAWASAASAILVAFGALVDRGAGPLSAGTRSVAAAWIAVGVGLPLATAVSMARYHTFGIFRLTSFMTDYRLWTALWGILTFSGVITATWVLARATALGQYDAAVAGVAVVLGAAALPIWRRLQAGVNERFGQHREDPAATIERIAAGGLGDIHDRRPLRGSVFDLLQGLAPIVVVDGTDGMRFALPTNDREVGRHTFIHGSYDLATIRCAMAVLGEERGRDGADGILRGTTVLDVGANIGTSIVPLLMLYGADRGIAVEPEPRNVEMLGLNLSLNGLTDRVAILPIGLSDRDGRMQLELSRENSGDHRIRSLGAPPAENDDPRPAIAVTVRSLDSLVDAGVVDTARLGLAWLDVQGHEGHVLSGGRALLESSVPIVTEFWPSALDRMGGLARFVELVVAHVRRVVDLRATQAEGTLVETTAAGMDELVERYAHPSTFTDLLLLR